MNRLRRDSSPAPAPSPFFKLSRELRDIIYGLVFEERSYSGRPSHRKFLHVYDSFAVEHDFSGQEVVHGAVWCPDPQQNGYGMLGTCDQIRSEAMQFAVRGTEFDFRWVLKRQMSTRGWNMHGRVSDPWMHSMAFINNNSVSLRSLLYCSLAKDVRFITLQHELLERETWSYSSKKSLNWWPKHVKLEQLTVVVTSKHEDGRYGFSWIRQSIIEKFIEIWQLVSPKKVTKKLVIEAQELCSEPTLTDDLADQLTKAAKSLLEKEISGSLPNEVVVQSWPTLDVKLEQQPCQRIQDAISQKKPMPVTLAMMSMVARTNENSQEPMIKEIKPFEDAADAEASLVKPFAGPRPRDSWEYSEEMIRVHGSHRRRWSRRHRRLLRSEEKKEEEDSQSETEKIFDGVKNELTHALQRARCVLKAKRWAAEVSGQEESLSDSSSVDGLWRTRKTSQKKQKKTAKKRSRADASLPSPSTQPKARRRRTNAESTDAVIDQQMADVDGHGQRSANLAMVSAGEQPASKPSTPSERSEHGITADLDALMQERNRLDAEILSRLTKMRGEMKH